MHDTVPDPPPPRRHDALGCHDALDRRDGSDQLALELTHARRSDPPTSSAAARSLDPRAVGKEIARAVEVVTLRGSKGATCAEVVAATGGDRGCTARRLTDAAQRGLIVASGRTRPGPSGRQQIVWLAAAAAREAS